MSSRQKGLTLVEVLVGMGILAVLIFASLSLTTSALQMTRLNLDRQFATEKAISILEELKSVAQNVAATNGNVVVLDQYDDGVNYIDALTIQPGVLPGDAISGNVTGPNGWLYQRNISVTRIGGQSSAGVRLVRVSVYRNDQSGMHLLAEVSSVIRTLATTMPQSQVYDVYAIAVENVPGWWVYTSSLVPFVQDAISELEDRNPGLQYRVHWITKLSYGRDQEYRPYMNRDDNPSGTPPVVNPSTNDINYVYFYPGSLPQDNAALNPPDLDNYYPPSVFKAHMLMGGAANVDTNNYDATQNPVPYALADQYNHAMRYYDEKAIFMGRVAAGLEDATTPTYRLLMDDMIMNPAAYTNAILINLHGELFPFAPTRNFSDAAKAPDPVATAPNNLTGIRVVTHPEYLEYNPGSAVYPNVNLRVYAYEAPTGSSGIASGVLPVPVTVVIPGVDLTTVAGTVSIQRIEGGLSPAYYSDNALGYVQSAAPAGVTAGRMSATVTGVTVSGVPNTVIKLVNTPFRHPPCNGANCNGVTNNTGLPATGLLYNQQYIPAPMENFAQAAAQTAFGTNLATNAGGIKNTARWIISINSANLVNILNAHGFPGYNGIPPCPAPCANTALAVETRIGDIPAGLQLPTTGTMWPVRNQPPNLSRTYVWFGSNLWLYGDGTNANLPNLPMTERYQFIGDPRHCPYADLKKPHSDGGAGWNANNINAQLGMGYNRNFDDFENSSFGNASAAWPGWTYTLGGTLYGVRNDTNRTNDGFAWGTTNGQIELDVERAFQTVRNALTSSQAIYTTMTGWSYYYIGIGGEIGYDAANQFPNSIPLSAKPFTGLTGNSTEQSIINGCATCGVKYVRQDTAGTNYWWAMNWLGELYPDTGALGNYYTNANGWAATGNLPTGPNLFRRVIRGSIGPTTGGFILPNGTTFNECPAAGNCPSDTAAVRRTGGPGSTSLFWTGSSGSTFHHWGNDNNGSLILQGLDIASPTTGYNFPLLNPVPNNRPFSLTANITGDNPDLFLSPVYGPVFPSSEQAQFYWQSAASTTGSALEALRSPVSNKVAFIVVNGLSPVGASGSNYIARWAFLSLMHSYFLGGLYPVAGTEVGCAACTFRVKQLPRVSITFPTVNDDLNNPGSINITWTSGWTRWDGNKYTPAYAANFSETEPVQYQVMYSADNGATWKWCDTSIPGTPSIGVRTSGAAITATNFNWSTPASTFPMGNYLIRIEAYRQNYTLHYSFHQFRAFIRR
jgi:type II secretory pathway pseudopilin PulG